MRGSIAILIPVFNEIQFTQQCLRNLKEVIDAYQSGTKEGFDIRLLLIDDGSSDGTSKWVKKHYPEVRILKGDGSLFWSGAINMGIAYVLERKYYSHILFWNKDLFIENNYLNVLQDIILKKNNVIIASKMYRKSSPNTLFSFGGTFNPNTGKKVNIGSGKIDGIKYNKISKIDWCGGMAVCIPIEVFLKTGICDADNFPQYDGDTDFFLRTKKHGFKLFVFPELKAWNIHENTGKKENYTIKNYLWHLRDIRSFKNLKVNYMLLTKHSVGVRPYLNLIRYYMIFTLKYSTKLIISKFK